MAVKLKPILHVPSARHLAKLWRKWTHMATMLAKKKVGHQRISDEQFQALHHEILEACDACAAQFGPRLRPVFRKMKHIVEPWVTPDTIRHAERPIREDLLTQTYHIERLLHPGVHLGANTRLLAFGLLAIVLGGVAEEGSERMLESFRRAGRSIRLQD